MPDAKFWTVHARWKALQDAVQPEVNDAPAEQLQNDVYAAFNDMWLTPISSAYALSAKLHSIDFAEAELPAPAGSTTEMLKWDLQRMVMRELGASPVSRDDAAVLGAWERRKTAYQDIDLVPNRSDRPSPEEKRLWELIASAEKEIGHANPGAPAAIEAQLWTGLYHAVASPELEEDNAILNGDLEQLEGMGDSLDSNLRLIVRAIRSLRNMGARPTPANQGNRPSRLDIVDRANAIRDYLDLLLRNIWQDLEIAQVLPVAGDHPHSTALDDVQRSLALAQELVEELGRLYAPSRSG